MSSFVRAKSHRHTFLHKATKVCNSEIFLEQADNCTNYLYFLEYLLLQAPVQPNSSYLSLYSPWVMPNLSQYKNFYQLRTINSVLTTNQISHKLYILVQDAL